MKAVKENAYAKINLYLDVTAKRIDGFHNVRTVMHSVSLADTVTVSYSPAKTTEITLSVEGNSRLVDDEKNLAHTAARLYMSRAAVTGKIHIKLDKRIPVAAGLAGGSTDAAATLRAINKIFDKRLSRSALLSLAAELGSDVPYCVRGGTAYCEGRGEIMTDVLTEASLKLVLAVANEHVSTPSAYKALDEIYSDFDGSVPHSEEEKLRGMLASLRKGVFDTSTLFNIFESAVLTGCPLAAKIKAEMTALGAKGVLMSGSGPSIFGVFDSEDSARAAESALLANGYHAFYAESV